MLATEVTSTEQRERASDALTKDKVHAGWYPAKWTKLILFYLLALEGIDAIATEDVDLAITEDFFASDSR